MHISALLSKRSLYLGLLSTTAFSCTISCADPSEPLDSGDGGSESRDGSEEDGNDGQDGSEGSSAGESPSTADADADADSSGTESGESDEESSQSEGESDGSDSDDGTEVACPERPEWIVRDLPDVEASTTNGLFIAASGRTFIRRPELWFSDDEGATWSLAEAPGDAAMVLTELPSGDLLGATAINGDKVPLLSEDSGTTWIAFDGPTVEPHWPLIRHTALGVLWWQDDWLFEFDLESRSFESLMPLVGEDNVPGNQHQAFVASADGTLFSQFWLHRGATNRWLPLTRHLSEAERDELVSPVLATPAGTVYYEFDDELRSSRDLGKTWRKEPLAGVPDAMASDAEGRVVALFARSGLQVACEGGWQTIETGAGTSIHGSLAFFSDGRLAFAWRDGDGNGKISVTSEPLGGDPEAGLVYPDACSDGKESADEDHIDCGGPCLPCSHWSGFPGALVENLRTSRAGSVFADVKVGRDDFLGRWSADEAGEGRWKDTGLDPGSELLISETGVVYAWLERDDEIGLMVSTDDGASFEDAGAVMPTSRTVNLRVTPGGVLLHAGGGDALDLHWSMDHGQSWTLTDFPPFAVGNWSAIHPTRDDRLLATTGDELWTSEDHGATWSAGKAPWPAKYRQRLQPTLGGGVLAIYDTLSIPDWFSPDGGESWIDLPGLDADEPTPSRVIPSPGGRIVALEPERPSMEVYLLDESGARWQHVSTEFQLLYTHYVEALGDDRWLAANADGQLWVSRPVDEW